MIGAFRCAVIRAVVCVAARLSGVLRSAHSGTLGTPSGCWVLGDAWEHRPTDLRIRAEAKFRFLFRFND